ncbi:hypothetical protein QF037_009489 [Streptomyces canus]|uniref:hypothetical protein n=1 Tax=Streptomyces canus TaxID=58343 RepID=UPI0027860929|nr:hypothetical protein [Streptomyces canus]MDQ0605144.1 hypothetical protein [Streptomyces canus]
MECVARADQNDITLGGHSWRGYVLTGAAPKLASGRRLVSWSASVLGDGEEAQRIIHSLLVP